jgi:hypothetical protein
MDDEYLFLYPKLPPTVVECYKGCTQTDSLKSDLSSKARGLEFSRRAGSRVSLVSKDGLPRRTCGAND